MTFRPATAAYLHPGLSAELLSGGKSLGTFGQLHPRYADKLSLGARLVLAGEFDLDAMLAALPSRYAYSPVPRFPAALRDVAVIVDDDATA